VSEPYFENRPNTDLTGLQSALVRYFGKLIKFIGEVQNAPVLPDVGPGAGTYGGGSSFIESVTLDDQGRVTALTSDVPTSTPSGAAGGDLGGTYPNPEVAAITETSGPDQLTIGAVADGEFTRRVGSTLVGATPTRPVTLRGFRSLDPGGAFSAASTRIHWAGLCASNAGVWVDAVSSAAVQAAAGGMAYAYPEHFETARTINRLVISTRGRGGAAGGNVRLGVYANTTLSSGSFAGSDYPGARLGQSSNLAYPAGADSLMESVGLSIAVGAGEKVWFVFVQDAAGVTGAYSLFGYGRGSLFPFLGFTIDAVSPTTIPQDNATAGVCWRHSITYTGTESFPDPFPQTSPVVGVQAASGTIVHPAVGFGFQA
jgi:hypothetical protein